MTFKRAEIRIIICYSKIYFEGKLKNIPGLIICIKINDLPPSPFSWSLKFVSLCCKSDWTFWKLIIFWIRKFFLSQIYEVTWLTMCPCKLQEAGSGEPTGSYRIRDRERRSRVRYPTTAAPSIIKRLLEILLRAVYQSMGNTVGPWGMPVL